MAANGRTSSEVSVRKPDKLELSLEEAARMLQGNSNLYPIRAAFELVRRALSREEESAINRIIDLGFPVALVQALQFDVCLFIAYRGLYYENFFKN